jgi:hypothetical protein
LTVHDILAQLFNLFIALKYHSHAHSHSHSHSHGFNA